MKCTQNGKVLQIKNGTLVVGIDIAKEIRFAQAFDNRGTELETAEIREFSTKV